MDNEQSGNARERAGAREGEVWKERRKDVTFKQTSVTTRNKHILM